ncbi:MAG: hypothetical protein ACFB21_02605 [Opitutales bacterium]
MSSLLPRFLGPAAAGVLFALSASPASAESTLGSIASTLGFAKDSAVHVETFRFAGGTSETLGDLSGQWNISLGANSGAWDTLAVHGGEWEIAPVTTPDGTVALDGLTLEAQPGTLALTPLGHGLYDVAGELSFAVTDGLLEFPMTTFDFAAEPTIVTFSLAQSSLFVGEAGIESAAIALSATAVVRDPAMAQIVPTHSLRLGTDDPLSLTPSNLVSEAPVLEPLNETAIPEPGAALPFAGAGLLAAIARRRQRGA